MQLFLTFDYELFFGSQSGTVGACLLHPTEKLLALFEKYEIQTTFFVDASYLLCLKKDAEKNPFSQREWESIATQLRKMISAGHELGLHLHPHWMDCFRKEKEWTMHTSRYRFHSLSKEEQKVHFKEAFDLIKNNFYPGLLSFRAGGWCIQPFEAFYSLFKEQGILIDSSVVPGMRLISAHHHYDFTGSAGYEVWKFEHDPCRAEPQGSFLELPVTPDKIPPGFQFKMFFLHRWNPEKNLPLGDGIWIKDAPSQIKKYFFTWNGYASADGRFCERLPLIYQRLEKENISCMTILSHPKSLSPFSFEQLEKFIRMVLKKKSSFKRVRDILSGNLPTL